MKAGFLSGIAHRQWGAALNVAEAKADETDALKVSGKTKAYTRPTAGQLLWIDERSFRAASWGNCLDLTNVTVTTPRPGTQRVVIRGG